MMRSCFSSGGGFVDIMHPPSEVQPSLLEIGNQCGSVKRGMHIIEQRQIMNCEVQAIDNIKEELDCQQLINL